MYARCDAQAKHEKKWREKKQLSIGIAFQFRHLECMHSSAYKLKIMSMTRHFNRLCRNAHASAHISLLFASFSIHIEFNESLSRVRLASIELAHTQITDLIAIEWGKKRKISHVGGPARLLALNLLYKQNMKTFSK